MKARFLSLISAPKIIAIGRNYAAHAKELGNSVPDSPFFFLKPPSSLLTCGGKIVIPPSLDYVHYEVELGVLIGEGGKNLPKERCMEHVSGYAIAIDMTARQIQDSAKVKSGLPWTISKGFDTFTPISNIVEKDQIADPHNLELWLKVDSEEKQRGHTGDMINKIPELISFVSKIMTLSDGDLILTGTPKGVGPVKSGQVITAGITGIPEFNVTFPVVQG